MTTFRAWPSRDANGRTKQRVRRDSREALDREPQAYLTPRQRRERLQAFRRQARAARPAGKRWGSPGCYSLHSADVLDFLMYHAVQSGRVFPSYREISAAVGCAYRTAVRCVRQLAAGGWLAWERRFIRIGSPGAAEPQVVQTSNLYHLHLPTAAARMIEAWTARRPPAPDSLDGEISRRGLSAEAEAAEIEAAIFARRQASAGSKHFLRSLALAKTPEAVALVLAGEARLKNALGRWGEALTAKREFPEGSQAPA